MQAVRSKTELQNQKAKLANSYHELLEEFSSKELGTVGNYTLGRLIGKGSFGKVYLASHKLTNGSKVVLKSAKKDDSNLAREIHHHRQFLHPHIARLYEVIVTENLVWLVLEYCAGDELYNYLLQNGPIQTEKVQRIFTQLVGAVAYVHNMSCVHRDLKLENILLDKNENVKLCDFGFTRDYEGKASYLQTFCGTVCYSAPEMLKGEKYAGEKVDVWSLGIILYALLTGELPFDEDDELATKHKILGTEPAYPASLPADAKALIVQMLSKRPLMRPTIADILTSPFLAEHAPHQQAVLKLTRPAPFTTLLEKETMERMRIAGVNVDRVVENVIAQRCDSLAGWWALLIEKEQRKEKRRERKRKEREHEAKNLRRLSAASTRLERIAPTLTEVDEAGLPRGIGDPPRSRGRRERRSIPNPQLVVSDLPRLPEGAAVDSPGSSATPPPPIEKDTVRSSSSSRQRPPPPPKERRRSKGSTLNVVVSTPDLLAQQNGYSKNRSSRRHHHPFINQLAAIKHWFMESAKRAKSPSAKSTTSMVPKQSPSEKIPVQSLRSPIQPEPLYRSGSAAPPNQPARPSITPRRVTTPHKRSSLSPAPLTPHSSYRRSTHGLRGRKSTSSSISSIRSIHPAHPHSKASSTSSTSTSNPPSAHPAPKPARSPHNSIKVLPATPTTSAFPSNIRLVRAGPPAPSTPYNEPAHFGPLPSPGLVFARRKKSPFKGPMLNVSTAGFGSSNIGGGGGRARESSAGSRSASAVGRRSEEIIEEEDEEEVEEVEAFSPVGVDVEETIWEGGGGAEGGSGEKGGWMEYGTGVGGAGSDR